MFGLNVSFYLCDTVGFLRIMYFIKLFLNIIRFVVPIIVICMIILDLVRNVIKADINIIEPTLDKSAKNGGLYTFLEEAVRPF